MDIDENVIYLSNEVIPSNSITNQKTPVIIGSGSTESNEIWVPIVKEFKVLIPIPKGYQIIQGRQLSTQTSFAQIVKAVLIKEEIPVDLDFVDTAGNIINMDSLADIYQIKLVGNLYYNVVASNFEPIRGSSTNENTLFNTFSGVVFNEPIGYVRKINQLPPNIEDKLTYNILIDTYNPSQAMNTDVNETQKYENKDSLEKPMVHADLIKTDENIRALATDYYITVNVTMTISYNQAPIS